MTNVITFPAAQGGRVECRTNDLSEALWMSAFLLREHEQFVFDVAFGKATLVDDRGQPDPTVFGPDPAIIFADQQRPVASIIEIGRTIEAGTPLPAHMAVFFALWNANEPGWNILTYGDAVELMENCLWNIQWERDEYFKKRGGAS